MVIDKLHGLQATGLSLNDRFTILATTSPLANNRMGARFKHKRGMKRNTFVNHNNFTDRHLIQQLTRQLEQAKRQALKQRLGKPGQLRRFGSEGNLTGLWRSGSFGNLSQGSVKTRVSWRQSNGNLSRSASFNNLSQGHWRPKFRRRGGNRVMQGRFRGGGRQGGARLPFMTQVTPHGKRGGQPRGMGRGGQSGGIRRGGQPGGIRRGGQAGGARRGILRNQAPKPIPTKEELDAQLDLYMASTKTALDRELDIYMKNAMELE